VRWCAGSGRIEEEEHRDLVALELFGSLEVRLWTRESYELAPHLPAWL
jgi:hypothetical protein